MENNNIKKIEVPQCHCEKCGHDWISRVPNPVQCPKCKVYNFYLPKGINTKREEKIKLKQGLEDNQEDNNENNN